MGYFVVTLPPEVRSRYRTKKALAKLGTALKRMFQRHGFKRGLRRWHWFGDRRRVYHPHLNVLVDGGLLSREKLGEIKASVASILGVELKRANVHYHYEPDDEGNNEGIRWKLHKIGYVLRSTFLDWRWDSELARELIGIRNANAWGKKKIHWDGPPAWEIPPGEDEETSPAVEALEAGRCPYDGTEIHWGKILEVGSRAWDGSENLGAGYWTRPRRGS